MTNKISSIIAKLKGTDVTKGKRTGRLRLLFHYYCCDMDEEPGPKSNKRWAVIAYACMPANADALGATCGMTPIRTKQFSKYNMPVLFDNLDSIYGDDAYSLSRRCGLQFGYVRVYRASTDTRLASLDDLPAIRKQFRLERNLRSLPPEDRDSFIIRVDTMEVYPEYYGAYWKDHCWDSGYREIFPHRGPINGVTKRYMLGDSVYYHYDLLDDQYMIGVAKKLMALDK